MSMCLYIVLGAGSPFIERSSTHPVGPFLGPGCRISAVVSHVERVCSGLLYVYNEQKGA